MYEEVKTNKGTTKNLIEDGQWIGNHWRKINKLFDLTRCQRHASRNTSTIVLSDVLLKEEKLICCAGECVELNTYSALVAEVLAQLPRKACWLHLKIPKDVCIRWNCPHKDLITWALKIRELSSPEVRRSQSMRGTQTANAGLETEETMWIQKERSFANNFNEPRKWFSSWASS